MPGQKKDVCTVLDMGKRCSGFDPLRGFSGRPAKSLDGAVRCGYCGRLKAEHARFKVGDLVWTYFDTGAFGAKHLFGVVIEAGPRAYRVRWHSDLTNRIRYGHGDAGINVVNEPELLCEARRLLRLLGDRPHKEMP